MSKKVKVFVDAEVLVSAHFSGIGYYTLELLKAIDEELDTRNDIEIILGVFYRKVHLVKAFGFKNFRIVKTPFPLRVSNGLKIKGRQPYYDLFFGKQIYWFPNYTSWPLLFSKSVTTVYDLSFEYYPQFVEPRNQKFLSDQVKKSAERSQIISTISKNSQKEIIKFYEKPEPQVPIIYPGVDQSKFYRRPKKQVDSVKAKYGVHGDYILFVGNIEPRKNLKNLLLAYEQLDQKIRKTYSLLLVGARGWLDNEIFEIIERLRIAGNHIQQPIDYVKDEDRPAIYSGASLFVYPSLYEGFGIPPIEAMACGVPVISSDNSSLPEAVGDAARTIEADNIGQLTDAIKKTLTSSGDKENMVKKGYIQADEYTWQNSAKKMIKIFEELNS